LSKQTFTNQRPRTNRYLFVGRLIETKGILSVLEASKTYNFQLDIIGDGPLKTLVQDYSKNNTNVSYLGFQNQEYILEKMSTCKALIFPSLKIEGFPVTIVEAFSVSTPVIAANNGPINEIIHNNENGFLYNTTSELIDILKKIDSNETFIEPLYDKSNESYTNLYSQDINYKKLMSIYSSLISKKNA